MAGKIEQSPEQGFIPSVRERTEAPIDPVEAAYLAVQRDLDLQQEAAEARDRDLELSATNNLRIDFIALRETVLARIPPGLFPKSVNLITEHYSRGQMATYRMGEDVSRDTVTLGEKIMGFGQFTRHNGIARRVVGALIQSIPPRERRQYQRGISEFPFPDST